jgi:hypothetical protein
MNGLLPYWPLNVVSRKLKTVALVSVFLASAVLMLA